LAEGEDGWMVFSRRDLIFFQKSHPANQPSNKSTIQQIKTHVKARESIGRHVGRHR
jgi:hypothetical protein